MKKTLSKILIGILLIGVFLIPNKNNTAEASHNSQPTKLYVYDQQVGPSSIIIGWRMDNIHEYGSLDKIRFEAGLYKSSFDWSQPTPPGIQLDMQPSPPAIMADPGDSNYPQPYPHTQGVNTTFVGLTADTTYFVLGHLWSDDLKLNIYQPLSIKTGASGTSGNSGTVQTLQGSNWQAQEWCSNLITDFGNCMLGLIHWLVWGTVSALAELAARILDFFIYYSITSGAYTNDFVDKAWAAVRDVANVFFILALLYVALKTILDANVSSQKRILANIIIFALLINFSLFASKVVIDASNILARIFYSQITPYGKNGEPLQGFDGEKSVTVGLVRNFNPQDIILQSENSSFMDRLTVLVIAILVVGYMIYIFLSVALLFVARVASLWIAMIFAPFAFASFAFPFSIPGFGHQKWSSMLFSNAFLAPIFVFFLYILILFGGFMKQIVLVDSNSGNYYERIMPVLIPFLITVVLLKIAKKLAEDYSGELGAAVRSAGAKLTGWAVGGAAGVTAAVARGGVLGVGGLGRMADAYKSGSSRPATGPMSKVEQFMQRTPILRGLRQAATLGLVKRPGKKESARQEEEKRHLEENRKEGTLPTSSLRDARLRSLTTTEEGQKEEVEILREGEVITPARVLLENIRRNTEGMPKAPQQSSETTETTASQQKTGEEEKTIPEISKTTKPEEQKTQTSAGTEARRITSSEPTSQTPGYTRTPGGIIIPEEGTRVDKITEADKAVLRGNQTPAGQPQVSTSGEVSRGVQPGVVGQTPGAITTPGQINVVGSNVKVGTGASSEVVASGTQAKSPEGDKDKVSKATESLERKSTEKEEVSDKKKDKTKEEKPLTDSQKLIQEIIEAVKKGGKVQGGWDPNLADVVAKTPSVRTIKDDVAEKKGLAGAWAKLKYNTATKAATGTWDFRNTWLSKMIEKNTGLDFSTSFYGANKGKGGFVQMAKDKQNRQVALAKDVMPKGPELSALNSLNEDLKSITNYYEEIARKLGMTDKERSDFMDAAKSGNEEWKSLEAAQKAELSRINGIRYKRSTNMADTVARGGGNIVDSLWSNLGFYKPENISAAERIRIDLKNVQARETPDTQTKMVTDVLKTLMEQELGKKEDEGTERISQNI